ncbi:lef1 DNA primase [Peridroma alphabaculovirus]|uniref:Lef1 DNA primase n=1 Tax=Peridroma alphabaculovirus TaxID=1346829 RepID=A0A068LRB3_9ABAC|nr:lef1 DNA primase [Peridroma alphabaculovirus]AIE47745.1 lef1 DNA primase [Peridroma alphabaculovirus]
MLKRKNLYSREQVELMWNSVAFNDARPYAFFDGARWYHPDRHFGDAEDLYQCIQRHNVSDVHVKALDNDGGREWVVDVDVEAADAAELQLKIRVAARTFRSFFGDNVARIVHSGNRGIHVWLRIDRFPMSASKEDREKYYKVFAAPSELPEVVPEGCFAYAFKEAVSSIAECANRPLLSLWPTVDKHVFCNQNQIRVPHSYNYKGKKFSTLWTEC